MYEGIENEIGPRLRPLQIVVAAMVVGATAFLIVAAVIGRDIAATYRATSPTPILTYIGTGFAVVALIARALIPRTMTTSMRARIAGARQDSAARGRAQPPSATRSPAGYTDTLCTAYAGMTIIRAACTEGAALLAGLAFLLEREPLGAVVGIVMILALAAQIPTHTGMAQWLRDQLRYIEETRLPTR